MQDVEAGLVPPPGLADSNEHPLVRAKKEIMKVLAEENPNREINDARRLGKITKKQAKQLKATVRRLQSEYLDAWAAGEDLELFTRRIQVADSELGMEISAFGGKPSEEQCLIGDGKWLRIRNGITMDSGSSVFVIPSGWLTMFPAEESEGSRKRQTYTAAAKDGKPIINEGQKTIKFITDEGQKKKMVCQIAKVNKILASIAAICDKHNEVVFRKDGGEITSLTTGQKTPFRRLGNVYVMDAWVLNPKFTPAESKKEKEELMTFARPVVDK